MPSTLMTKLSKKKIVDLGITNMNPNFNKWIKRLATSIFWMYAITYSPSDFKNFSFFSIPSLLLAAMGLYIAANSYIAYLAGKAIMYEVEELFLEKNRLNHALIGDDEIRSYFNWPDDMVMMATYLSTMAIMATISFMFFESGNLMFAIVSGILMMSFIAKDFIYAIIIRNQIRED